MFWFQRLGLISWVAYVLSYALLEALGWEWVGLPLLIGAMGMGVLLDVLDWERE